MQALLCLLLLVGPSAVVGSRAEPGVNCTWCEDVPYEGTNLAGEVAGRSYHGCDVKYDGPGALYGIARSGSLSDCCGWCAEVPGCDGWTWDSNNGGACFFKHVNKCKAWQGEPGQTLYSATLKSNSQPGRCKYDPDQVKCEPCHCQQLIWM